MSTVARPAGSAAHAAPLPATPSAAGPPPSALPAQPLAATALVGAPPPGRCENCDAPLSGRYCAACGQRREPPVHSLWHFMRVAAEDLTHADSRLWRTLAALLLRPGYLTREFLAGHRARYLPPLRLYLVLSVVFFLYASATHNQSSLLQISVPDHGPPAAAMTPLAGERASPLDPRPGESAQQRAERICDNARYQGPWREFVLSTGHRACVRAVVDNGRALREAFLHNVPRAMFVFLPVLAAVMMLMYWRPRRYYVEHLLLFVHNHAFVFLLLLLAAIVSTLLPATAGWINLSVALYIAWYAYRSMRVVYVQSRRLTLSKLAVLAFFYVLSGSLMLTITSIYSALTL